METTPTLTRSCPRVSRVAGLRIDGHSLPVMFGDAYRLTVGRTRQRTIQIEHTTVSRRHCVITRTPEGLYQIANWESDIGVWISPLGRYSEYHRIETAILQLGMFIKLGEVRLRTVDEDGRCPMMVTSYGELIRESKQAYHTPNEAGRHIGRSRKTIERVLDRIGVARRKRTRGEGDE